MCIAGGDIEPDEFPKPGAFKGGFVTAHNSPHSSRSDAVIIRYNRKIRRANFALPTAWDDWVPGVGAGGYGAQVALTLGAERIACLGVDWNANDELADGRATHFYGRNVNNAIPSRNPGDMEIRLWKLMLDAVECWNLSPYAGTPFERLCGWPRMSWEEWATCPV